MYYLNILFSDASGSKGGGVRGIAGRKCRVQSFASVTVYHPYRYGLVDARNRFSAERYVCIHPWSLLSLLCLKQSHRGKTPA